MKKEYDLKGNIRSNSIIMCEMMITSDNEFFDKIGLEETKRYFRESYKFVCNYKNLGERNIVSAAVHLDETIPHMHLVYIPVIHTKDKEGKDIDKICCRDFWKGRDSYRQLQNAFHKYITSKGFDLERGLPVEETGAKHEKIEDLKKITNFENTKKVLDNIKLELPEVPDINDIKLFQLNKTKVENDIIKPKDDLINELYNDNKALHQELSKQVKLVNEAEKYQKERDKILADNRRLNNKVKDLEFDYNNRKNELEDEIKMLKELYQNLKSESTNPVGTLISYMGNNVPNGYLPCNGQTYNIAEYSGLAEQIKREFGSYNYYGGDGTTTFATPNVTGKFLKGSNQAGIREEAGLPNISGGFLLMLGETPVAQEHLDRKLIQVIKS